jgi:hypothetical protein
MTRIISNARAQAARFVPEAVLLLFLVASMPLVVLAVRGVYGQLAAFASSPTDFFTALRNDLASGIAAVVCIVVGSFVLVLLARNWQPIWAVARKMVVEALHRKVVIVLFLFFAVLMPSLPFLLKTEGSLTSQIQLLMLYSLALALALLSLLAIFLTTASVCSEIELKHVHITDTKPLRRWHFLVGKWLGSVVLCSVALAVMAAGTYGLALLLMRPPHYADMDRSERERSRADRERLHREVFVARKAIQTELPGSNEQIDEMVMEWLADQPGPIAAHSYKEDLIKEMQRVSQTVQPNETRLWRFAGLRPEPDGSATVQVRFKAFPHGALTVFGKFTPFEQITEGTDPETGKARVRYSPTGQDEWSPPGGWDRHSFHEVHVPARHIGQDGVLWLGFQNWTRGSVTFDIDDPIEVLQAEEGFLVNYYRALVVLMLHLSLLAALGLMAGSLFSFPVASLLVCCLFVGGLLASWFQTEFVDPNPYAELTPATIYLDYAWRAFAGAVLKLMPDFGRFSPLGHLVSGRLVGMGHLARAASGLLLLRGGAAMLIGAYFYTRRELARIIV